MPDGKFTEDEVKRIDLEVPTNILPDSRTLGSAKQVTLGFHPLRGMLNNVPIYCANCGADGGFVPEEYCTFAFYLCETCGERWGALAATYWEPERVFWEKVRQHQLETYGRILTPDELRKKLSEHDHALLQLAREGPYKDLKGGE